MENPYDHGFTISSDCQKTINYINALLAVSSSCKEFASSYLPYASKDILENQLDLDDGECIVNEVTFVLPNTAGISGTLCHGAIFTDNRSVIRGWGSGTFGMEAITAELHRTLGVETTAWTTIDWEGSLADCFWSKNGHMVNLGMLVADKHPAIIKAFESGIEHHERHNQNTNIKDWSEFICWDGSWTLIDLSDPDPDDWFTEQHGDLRDEILEEVKKIMPDDVI